MFPRSELIASLKELSKSLGRTPRGVDLRSGEFSLATYQRRFGSFNKALREAGLEVNKVGRASDAELLNALTVLAKLVDRTPTKTEMDKFGRFSGAVYTNRFGSWAAACEEAGLKPNRLDSIPDETLL